MCDLRKKSLVRLDLRRYNNPELVAGLHKQLKAAGLETGPAKYTDFLPFDQVTRRSPRQVDRD